MSGESQRMRQDGVCGHRDGHAAGLMTTLHLARMPARVAGPLRLGSRDGGTDGPNRTIANSKMQMLILIVASPF